MRANYKKMYIENQVILVDFPSADNPKGSVSIIPSIWLGENEHVSYNDIEEMHQSEYGGYSSINYGVFLTLDEFMEHPEKLSEICMQSRRYYQRQYELYIDVSAIKQVKSRDASVEIKNLYVAKDVKIPKEVLQDAKIVRSININKATHAVYSHTRYGYLHSVLHSDTHKGFPLKVHKDITRKCFCTTSKDIEATDFEWEDRLVARVAREDCTVKAGVARIVETIKLLTGPVPLISQRALEEVIATKDSSNVIDSREVVEGLRDMLKSSDMDTKILGIKAMLSYNLSKTPWTSAYLFARYVNSYDLPPALTSSVAYSYAKHNGYIRPGYDERSIFNKFNCMCATELDAQLMEPELMEFANHTLNMTKSYLSSGFDVEYSVKIHLRKRKNAKEDVYNNEFEC